SFNASLTLGISDVEFTGPDGRTGKTKDNEKVLPNLFAVYPLTDKGLTLGLGISTPHGQSTVWDVNGPFAGAFPHEAEMLTLNFNPTLAGKVNEKLSYGVGVDIFWSELSFDQLFPWSVVTGVPGTPPGLAEAKGDGTGVGANIGLLYQLDDRQRVGLTYRSSVKVDYKGDFDLSGIPAPLGGLVAPGSDFSSEIEFPHRIGAGYGIQLNDKLRVGADLEWVQYSAYDSLPIDLGVNNAAGLFPSSIPQNWDDIVNWFFGGEYKLDDSHTLRAGYSFLETPIPDSTLAPTIPDADRHVLSVGVGLTLEKVQLDFGYAYSIFDDIDIGGSVNPAAVGSYDLESHLLEFTLNYTF
ncbi:MAG: long-chain fatty acid transport protein, partial [Verrucomicrobiales bacterium]